MGITRKMVEKLMGVNFRQMNGVLNDLAYDISIIKENAINASNLSVKNYELNKSQRDGLDALRGDLYNVRKLPEYEAAFIDKKPLISVCIATYNKSKELVETALQSVFNQTYQNFEIIIIGDECTDDTEQRIKKLRDDRITFINLPNRGPYPDDSSKRWMVAGSPGVDLAAVIAKGVWIARLDDDDSWSTDHLEKLLKLALKTKSEFVYGALERRNVLTNKSHLIYEPKPAFGQISFQGVLYLRILNFFRYDQQSYLVEEPTDWNLIRKMVASGIRYTSTKDVVGYINWIPNTNEKHR